MATAFAGLAYSNHVKDRRAGLLMRKVWDGLWWQTEFRELSGDARVVLLLALTAPLPVDEHYGLYCPPGEIIDLLGWGEEERPRARQAVAELAAVGFLTTDIVGHTLYLRDPFRVCRDPAPAGR